MGISAAWEEPFLATLTDSSVPAMLAIVDSLQTEHAGTPKASTKGRMIKLVRRCLKNNARQVFAIGRQLALSRSPGAQEIGAVLLSGVYELSPDRVNALLCRTIRNLGD